MNVQELISGIKDEDVDVRAKAWLNAGPIGASAIEPLAKVMGDSDFEVARAAKRAMWKIVRHAGRPGADDERKQVVASLIALVSGDRDVAVVCEALWMLSESAARKDSGKQIAGCTTASPGQNARRLQAEHSTVTEKTRRRSAGLTLQEAETRQTDQGQASGAIVIACWHMGYSRLLPTSLFSL